MKRMLFFAVFVLLLSGCVPSFADPIAPDNGLNGMGAGHRNVVVKEPPMNQVTFEIDERLVGKYLTLESARGKSGLVPDGEEYFEIKPDGTAEISFNTETGPVYYGPEQIEITAFYAEDGEMFIHFNLIDGHQTCIDKYGLSLSFNGHSSFSSFTLVDFWFGRRLNFYKQSYLDGVGVENRNVVVKEPPMNQATFEIDERLVGRYAALENNNGKLILSEEGAEYFEIRPDGTAELLLDTYGGTIYYGPEWLEITAFYSDTGRVLIHFNLIQGYWTYPASCGLSVFFEGDSDFTSFVSKNYLSSYGLKFIKTN